MFNTDFNAAIVAAGETFTAPAGHTAAVLEFVNYSASHFGFGVSAVTDGEIVGSDTVESYTANFVANGHNGKLTFTAAPADFPAGAAQYQGDHDADGDVPVATRWTVAILLDGPDENTTADENEKLLTLTKLVA